MNARYCLKQRGSGVSGPNGAYVMFTYESHTGNARAPTQTIIQYVNPPPVVPQYTLPDAYTYYYGQNDPRPTKRQKK